MSDVLTLLALSAQHAGAGDGHAADAHGAAHHHAEPGPLDHVVDFIFVRAGDLPVLTMHMVTLIVATLLMLWVMTTVGRNIATGPSELGHRRYVPRGRVAQMFEAIIVYLKDEMIQPILGERLTKRWLTFLLTLFFFIWFNNLLGLLPLLSIQHLFGGIASGDWH